VVDRRAVTVDDGYIAGIVRSRGSNGFVGNVYRWLNAPEAPFSWFYDLYHLWSLVSASTLWMRLPSTLLGLLCWWLLSRLVLPGSAGRRAPIGAVAGRAGVRLWWVPFNLGCDPSRGSRSAARGVSSRWNERWPPARCAAGRRTGAGRVTTAVTPGGLMAFVPFLAAALPAAAGAHAPRPAPARAGGRARGRTGLRVLLMVADQSLAGLVEATRCAR